jgi:hypothetical protein
MVQFSVNAVVLRSLYAVVALNCLLYSATIYYII